VLFEKLSDAGGFDDIDAVSEDGHRGSVPRAGCWSIRGNDCSVVESALNFLPH
jgi:hypothetical protein